MPNHADSDRQKRIEHSQSIEADFQNLLGYIQHARETCAHLPKAESSLAKLTKEWSALHGKKLPKSYATIYEHIKPKDEDEQIKTKAESAKLRQLLSEPEESILVNCIRHMADRGFPLTRKTIERYALEILRARVPDAKSIGASWFHRMLDRHPDIQPTWSKGHDKTRAKAVNPTVMDHYFTLLKTMLDEFGFRPEEIYGFDESGFPFGGDETRERVYIPKGGDGKSQAEGNRENVSVMVTICADGSYITPTIIFKGKKFDSEWAEVEAELRPQ